MGSPDNQSRDPIRSLRMALSALAQVCCEVADVKTWYSAAWR